MCGIVGYIGNKNAYSIIIKGLKRLEYRGYDSAGIALNNGGLNVFKRFGKVANLENHIPPLFQKSTIGIGHTRWATHGEPNDTNAHPHISQSGNLVIVHNGIIENYYTLKEALNIEGFKFKSETDTEVLVNLIEYFKERENLLLSKAIQYALNEIYGAYAIAVMDRNNPDEIVVAQLGSPLAIGIGDDEYFIASDASPFIEYTKDAIYLEDGEMGIIRREGNYEIRKIKNFDLIAPSIQELKVNLEQIEKGGYDHFMLKEIFEQPNSVYDTLRGRLLIKEGIIKMAGIWEHKEKFINANRIIIVGCGTSWHASLIGEYLFEELSRTPVEVEYASEFRYRNPIIGKGDILIAVSQSGETADTLAAIKLAKLKGAFIFGICNVVGSSIARIADAGAYTHAGPEIGVASTKAFTAQITILSLLALELGKHKKILSAERYMELCKELNEIPKKISETLNKRHLIKEISKQFYNVSNFLYLGRGINFPVALEGALKLKEISYIHAEGYPAAEMKHGPIALIDKNMPVVVIATKKGHYRKIVSNIEEIRARNGKIIAVVTEGDDAIKRLSDYVIEVVEVSEELSPLITTIPLQLLSYQIAVLRQVNVDQPRNLAKSVTVE